MSNDDPTPAAPEALAREDRITQRLAQQWAAMREERRPEPAAIAAGPSNLSQAQVPWGLDLAAAWGWRFLVIIAAGFVLVEAVAFFSVIALPAAIALLIAALVSPAVSWMTRHRVPRGLAAIVVVLGAIGFVGALLTFAGQQVANGANDLADSTVEGLGQIKTWLKDGPLNASDSQINDWINQAQEAITSRTENGELLSQVTEVGTTIGHVVAGFFIVLFSSYFFLADGDRIWAWFVRLSPRAARQHVDSSGRVAWISLTQFVRATVLVALVDAVGIMIGAAILQVPFVLAIGVLVFLGAFVPMVGATVAGVVAVLVALVDQGPITALLMLGVVVLVQQVEGHVLQPFLMGRWVSVHPLGVIFAIGAGILVAGIAGALVAVPLAAAANAVIQHLAANTSPGDDPVEELEEDYGETGARASVDPEDADD
ncbi:AI-2E family transporter [Nocardioides psychrotolerans]|uniref:Predicted PurR-regulated permease PerM n=1 Tax=Nocardioides psychrotolerans TaxID=1005945 RepID=A0A1I3IH59_9ACTN|nr:AI-2E family transporter [Nocardioides psychrotolerans]GEP37999.1 AI-2E family transporter [Nocardioides psychrotolerans]SFI47230.1 Predicted PurR-regulated permease PerM [Nocardioides psychrotolerans]